MSDYGKIKSRISREMKRGELSVSSTAVAQSVIDAINHFAKRRFWFNTGYEEVVTTPDTATIGSAVTGIIKIDSMKAAIGNRDYPLSPMTYREMERIDSGQWAGYPEYYAHYNNNIRLYPIPNATYTVKVSYIKELTDVTLSSVATSTNEWVDDCESMIRKRAKGELFENELRNVQEAQMMFQSAEQEYKELKRQTDGRQSGRVKATTF